MTDQQRPQQPGFPVAQAPNPQAQNPPPPPPQQQQPQPVPQYQQYQPAMPQQPVQPYQQSQPAPQQHYQQPAPQQQTMPFPGVQPQYQQPVPQQPQYQQPPAGYQQPMQQQGFMPPQQQYQAPQAPAAPAPAPKRIADPNMPLGAVNASKGESPPPLPPGMYIGFICPGAEVQDAVFINKKTGEPEKKLQIIATWKIVSDAFGHEITTGAEVRDWLTVSMNEQSNLYNRVKNMYGGIAPMHGWTPTLAMIENRYCGLTLEVTESKTRPGTFYNKVVTAFVAPNMEHPEYPYPKGQLLSGQPSALDPNQPLAPVTEGFTPTPDVAPDGLTF